VVMVDSRQRHILAQPGPPVDAQQHG
jgi:hypothetical protein